MLSFIIFGKKLKHMEEWHMGGTKGWKVVGKVEITLLLRELCWFRRRRVPQTMSKMCPVSLRVMKSWKWRCWKWVYFSFFFSNDAALGSQWSGAQLRGGNMKQNCAAYRRWTEQTHGYLKNSICWSVRLVLDWSIICLLCHLYYTSLDLIHPLDLSCYN